MKNKKKYSATVIVMTIIISGLLVFLLKNTDEETFYTNNTAYLGGICSHYVFETTYSDSMREPTTCVEGIRDTYTSEMRKITAVVVKTKEMRQAPIPDADEEEVEVWTIKEIISEDTESTENGNNSN